MRRVISKCLGTGRLLPRDAVPHGLLSAEVAGTMQFGGLPRPTTITDFSSAHIWNSAEENSTHVTCYANENCFLSTKPIPEGKGKQAAKESSKRKATRGYARDVSIFHLREVVLEVLRDQHPAKDSLCASR